MATHIQIGDISPRIQYTADGVQTAFTYPFPIFTDADVRVYEDAVLKTLTTDYAVTGAGNSAGGLVTFTVAPAVAVVITLKRALAIKRTTDFQESGEFRAKVINDELDYQTAVLQQLGDDLGRGLRLADTDPNSALTLPDAATRASRYLGFDAAGGPIATDAAGPIGPQGPAGNMDGANNLAELTIPATARSNLGLVIGADVLAPTGDGSGLTGIAGGKITPIRGTSTVDTALTYYLAGGIQVIDFGLQTIPTAGSLRCTVETLMADETFGAADQSTFALKVGTDALLWTKVYINPTSLNYRPVFYLNSGAVGRGFIGGIAIDNSMMSFCFDIAANTISTGNQNISLWMGNHVYGSLGQTVITGTTTPAVALLEIIDET